MEPKLTDEEICEQLIALAQTPEQISYLTLNNTAMLSDKIAELKQLVKREEENTRKVKANLAGMDEAYRRIIMEIIKKIVTEDNYYDW